MRKQNKYGLLCLLLMAALLLTACAGKENTNIPPHTDPSQTDQQPEPQPQPDPQPQEPDFSAHEKEFIPSPADENIAAACITDGGSSYLVLRQIEQETGEMTYSALVTLPNLENGLGGLVWSPDGTRLAYLEEESSDGMGKYCWVAIYTLGGTSVKTGVLDWWEDLMPAPTKEWFSDSDRLLIASRPLTIYSCSAKDYILVSQDTLVSQDNPFATEENAKSMDATLSPDEKYVAYELITDGGIDLMLYETATGTRRVLTHHTMPFEMCVGSSKPIWLSTTEVQWWGSTYRL